MTRRKRPDHYTDRAKKAGFPARSVYKLEEMDQKYHLIPPAGSVLDAGAAPGSWSLYVLRKLKTGRLAAVDLRPLNLKPDPKLAFFQGDLFSEEARRFMAEQGPYRLILSDAAPNTTGNRALDTARSAELARDLLALADEHLETGGHLAIKLFQGGEEKEIERTMKDLFNQTKRFTPQAVRKESFETYLIGLDRKPKPPSS